jgi:hypothetical protein
MENSAEAKNTKIEKAQHTASGRKAPRLRQAKEARAMENLAYR